MLCLLHYMESSGVVNTGFECGDIHGFAGTGLDGEAELVGPVLVSLKNLD